MGSRGQLRGQPEVPFYPWPAPNCTGPVVMDTGLGAVHSPYGTQHSADRPEANRYTNENPQKLEYWI